MPVPASGARCGAAVAVCGGSRSTARTVAGREAPTPAVRLLGAFARAIASRLNPSAGMVRTVAAVTVARARAL